MILIVDDVDEVGSISSEYLMRRVPNVEAFETTRPTEALAWLRTAPRVDLILSDHRMGEMDGVTFLRQARDLRPQATRALMTAYLDLPLPPSSPYPWPDASPSRAVSRSPRTCRASPAPRAPRPTRATSRSPARA